jgi:hypothetical protein
VSATYAAALAAAGLHRCVMRFGPP